MIYLSFNEGKADNYPYVLDFNVSFKFSVGDYVITLSRSLVVPFLTFSDRRDLREKAW